MRSLASFVTLFAVIGTVVAQSPQPSGVATPPTYSAMPPELALARAALVDGKPSLTLTRRVTICASDSVPARDVPADRVAGSGSEQVVPKDQIPIVCQTVFRPTRFLLEGEHRIIVTDLKGTALPAEEVLRRLEQQTPVLTSQGAPPDPYFLQTTRAETLVLLLPRATPQSDRSAASPPDASPSSPAKPRGEYEPTAVETQVIDLANAERKKVGLTPLAAEPRLTQAARQHTANMARQNKLDHTLDGKGIVDRLKDVGFQWSDCGENIAWGQSTPSDVVNSWMTSPGHRANILGSNFLHIGVARADAADGRSYWTMVLAKPR